MKRLLAVVLACAVHLACSKSSTAPTQSTTSTIVPATFTLGGRVTESAPTTSTAVPGAAISVADGPNAGKSATANANGDYTLTGLVPGGFTVNVGAPGYQDGSNALTVTASATRNFTLAPIPRTLDETHNGSVDGGSPICQNFFTTTTLPCVKYLVPVHNTGFLDAVLTWNSSRQDLDLELVREPGTGSSDRIAISRSASATREEVSATLTAGVLYSVRVLYYSGSVAQPFSLRLVRPN